MSMSNPDDSQFDDIFSEEEEISSEQQPRKPAANRGFMTLVGIIGGVMVLGVIALLYGIFFIMPQNNAQQAQQAAVIYAANTATSMAATQQAATAFFLMTPSATIQPTATNTAVNTPVVAPTATNTPEGGDAHGNVSPEMAATQTLSAQLTAMAAGGGGGALTVTPYGTPGTMPATGFGDEFGFPVLIGIGAILLVLIFVARRLRTH
ncbi:MAG TPA: hypothetical protein VN376_01325 [Longilinea sp.]|nr:hypothetical protein [Longilinea sp.]